MKYLKHDSGSNIFAKKQYIKNNIHLSELQDIYNLKLRENGFELERGIKGSDRKHQKVKEFKKTTRYYENKVETINKRLDNAMTDFEEKMKTTKNTIIDKEYVDIRKNAFYAHILYSDEKFFQKMCLIDK